MNVLITCNPNCLTDKYANPFVRFLYEGLSKYNNKVVVNTEHFWERPFRYDAVYIQWPDDLCFRKGIMPNSIIEDIKNQLYFLRSNNVKIIVTCHNFHSHTGDITINTIYNIIYQNADVIHHLGNYSLRHFMKLYPNKNHFVAYHPIFYDCKSIISSEKAKEKLRINPSKITIMSFGQFRNQGEREIIYHIHKHFPSLTLLCPRFIGRFKLHYRIYKDIPLLYEYVRAKWNKILFSSVIIEDHNVPSYFSAADLVLIQRNDILNSGNLPLGFSAGKIVIGPSVGNVGDILKNSGNFCFDPGNGESIIKAVSSALISLRQKSSIGENNYKIAISEWTPEIVANTINNSLMQLFTKC